MRVLRLRGHACALAVSSKVVPLTVKNRLWRFANCVGVRRRSPVAASGTAPVAFWYVVKALEAISTRVVPVSTIPAVVERIFVEVPNLIL